MNLFDADPPAPDASSLRSRVDVRAKALGDRHRLLALLGTLAGGTLVVLLVWSFALRPAGGPEEVRAADQRSNGPTTSIEVPGSCPESPEPEVDWLRSELSLEPKADGHIEARVVLTNVTSDIVIVNVAPSLAFEGVTDTGEQVTYQDENIATSVSKKLHPGETLVEQVEVATTRCGGDSSATAYRSQVVVHRGTQSGISMSRPVATPR